MVTDLTSMYTSPAGKEFSLLAARFAGVSPASKVLDIGCGYGAGSITLAKEFRCQSTAVDHLESNISVARTNAENVQISHLIDFQCSDFYEFPHQQEEYDLILAEGGVLSFLGRDKGLKTIHATLKDRGWFAFSDLVLLTEEKKIPKEVLQIFDNNHFRYESEASYRKRLIAAGYEVQIVTLVPPSGWDNYYAHMARHLEDTEGFFADRGVKEMFHREIDVFYRLDGFRYIGYLFALVRKK